MPIDGSQRARGELNTVNRQLILYAFVPGLGGA